MVLDGLPSAPLAFSPPRSPRSTSNAHLPSLGVVVVGVAPGTTVVSGLVGSIVWAPAPATRPHDGDDRQRRQGDDEREGTSERATGTGRTSVTSPPDREVAQGVDQRVAPWTMGSSEAVSSTGQTGSTTRSPESEPPPIGDDGATGPDGATRRRGRPATCDLAPAAGGRHRTDRSATSSMWLSVTPTRSRRPADSTTTSWPRRPTWRRADHVDVVVSAWRVAILPRRFATRAASQIRPRTMASENPTRMKRRTVDSAVHPSTCSDTTSVTRTA